METQTLIRLTIGLLMTAVVLVFAAARVLWLTKLDPVRSADHRRGRPQGQPRRAHHHADHRGLRSDAAAQVVDPGHRPLLHHVGLLHPRHGLPRGLRHPVQPEVPIPIVGHWDALGFLQDFIALAVVAGITTFAIIRLRSEPKEYGRDVAVLRLAHRRRVADPVMIFLVVWTYAFFRGASVDTGNFPYGWGAFFSHTHGQAAGAAGTRRQRGHRDRRTAGCTSPSCWSSC